jgi:sugar lactone lactonase YvrE
MIRRIQMMNRGQRIAIFILLFGGAFFLVVAAIVFVYLLAVNSGERLTPVGLVDGVTVSEFAQLPGDDAYPAALAAAPDGTLYTGSYADGAVWAIDTTGSVIELIGSREIFGSVSGLAVGPDGTLYVLDRLEYNPRSAGGALWRIGPEGDITRFTDITDAQGFIAPEGLAVDSAGRVYALDRGRREVWRFEPDGSGALWWSVPGSDPEVDDVLPNGIAYDATTDTILIADTIANTIYRVTLDGSTEVLYRYDGSDSNAPGFDGLTVGPDGAIYVAAPGQARVVVLRDGELTDLAEHFRTPSDVAYVDGQLYVTNFDSPALVQPGVDPKLPFTVDVLTLP